MSDYINIIDRCKICGKEFRGRIRMFSIYGEIKLLEELLDHVKKEHPNEKEYIKEIEEQIDRLYDIWEEEFYTP